MHRSQPALGGSGPLQRKMHSINARRATSLVVQCSKRPHRGKIFNEDEQQRAISVLRSAQQFEWREYLRHTPFADGTLVVSDAEHKELVQKAAAEKNLSFGFSAGGCLFPMYIGVAGALQDAGLLTEETKLGGASAGSLIAACIKSGMSLDEVTEQCLRLMHDCRVNGTRFRLGVSAGRAAHDWSQRRGLALQPTWPLGSSSANHFNFYLAESLHVTC